MRDEQPRPTRPARVGLGDPPSADVERDGRAVGVGRLNVTVSAAQSSSGSRPSGVERRGAVVGGQPRAADAHPDRQRPVGRDVVEVDADVGDAVRPLDVPDPRRARVDEVPNRPPTTSAAANSGAAASTEYGPRVIDRPTSAGRRRCTRTVAPGATPRTTASTYRLPRAPGGPARADRAPPRADAGPVTGASSTVRNRASNASSTAVTSTRERWTRTGSTPSVTDQRTVTVSRSARLDQHSDQNVQVEGVVLAYRQPNGSIRGVVPSGVVGAAHGVNVRLVRPRR